MNIKFLRRDQHLKPYPGVFHSKIITHNNKYNSTRTPPVWICLFLRSWHLLNVAYQFHQFPRNNHHRHRLLVCWTPDQVFPSEIACLVPPIQSGENAFTTFSTVLEKGMHRGPRGPNGQELSMSTNSRSKANFSFQFMTSYVWYSMEKLSGDLLFGLKLVQLSILPMLFIQFV